ncbi:MAG TPA: hypothetical protein DIC60_06420 [Lachnospiraceae bacterium]|nr:hypothetical protein [Lachnospiraceae bacterium]
MKKLISLILSATMILGSVPKVFAADNSLGDTLTSVTSKVKSQIDVGNEYTNFSGTAQDNGINEYWNLLWENEDNDARLSVNATAEGKIMNYNFSSDAENYRYESNFAPSFPKLTRDEAKEIAQKFLNKVIDTSIESVEFSDFNSTAQLQNTTNYYFNGNLKLNGLASPIDFSIMVNIATKSVTSFSRGDINTKYVGGVPSEKPSTAKDAASKKLYDTVKMKLEYTTDYINSNTGENDKGVLRYFPISTGDYLVDAQSGKLINKNDLYTNLDNAGFETDAVKESDATRGLGVELSKAEQDGIDKLAGVLPKEKLDAAVRAMSELNMTGFTLTDTNYSKNADDSYFCNLTYAKADEKNEITRKYVYVDAKSAELVSMYTNYPYDENAEKETISKADAQKKAEAFLAKYKKDNFAQTKLYTQTDSNFHVENSLNESFTYAQQANGYFFPENAYQVSVNTINGSIDGFSGNFRKVTFDSKEGIVSLEQAQKAYFNAFDTTLSYVRIPKKLDLSMPEYDMYIRKGYSYLYELKLAYTATAKNIPYAVDAKTGKNLCNEINNITSLTYSDVKTDKEILALASYGIGYAGGKFQKTKQLTQLDMVALLVSANGQLYNPLDNANKVDELYNVAYNLGILTKTQRNDNKNITRSELVKTVLSMSGYGKTAELQGIYLCNFKDEKSIPAQYYGYVAIAQGLGVVKGGLNEMFYPNDVATREQAAVILYNFMNR